MFSIPDEVGPHEGQELSLMLAGAKPLAMFSEVQVHECDEIPEEDFAPHVTAGHIIKRDLILNSRKPKHHKIRYVFYALPHEAWRIDRMSEINTGFCEEGITTTKELETEIGQLLGYSDHEITIYLAHWKKMTPFKKALSTKL